MNEQEIMQQLYKILCIFGLHHWIRGKGYIAIDASNGYYHDGYRCSTCGKVKP